jgi:hypothetical protein
MKLFLHLLILHFTVVLLLGCAASTQSIKPVEIPVVKYRDHSCSQLTARFQEVGDRAIRLAEIQNTAVKMDSAALAAGAVSLWFPVLFMSGGANKEEIAILKGEMKAIEQAALDKGCQEISSSIADQRQHACCEPVSSIGEVCQKTICKK